jgi:hypothetical protein
MGTAIAAGHWYLIFPLLVLPDLLSTHQQVRWIRQNPVIEREPNNDVMRLAIDESHYICFPATVEKRQAAPWN